MREDEEEAFEETKKEQKAARKQAIKRDRSRFKKTDQGKQAKKEAERHAKHEGASHLIRGRVLAILPEGILVESCLADDQKPSTKPKSTEDARTPLESKGLKPATQVNSIFLCSLRGTLKQHVTEAKNLATVGDFVLFQQTSEEEGSIASIEPRQSILSRQDHLRRKKRQLIAANIDQVLITTSVVHPPLKPALIDRYIIATLKEGMEPILVVNKIDLLPESEEEKNHLGELVRIYRTLNIPVYLVSAQTGEGIEALEKQMEGKASVFSGQSGVGKSALINQVTGLSLAVGEVVEKTRKGAHTTTSARLVPLPFGGWCIDTPGIRSFGIWDLKLEDLKNYFPEIAELSTACKFPNCTHTHEPECAIKYALDEETLSHLRFSSYLKLLEEVS